MLSVIVFPVITLVRTDQRQKIQNVQYVIHRAFRFFVWILQATGVMKLEKIQHREILTQCRGRIIIANHPTLIDVVILMSVVPQVQCVVKHQLWRNIFMRGVVSGAGYIRNDLAPDEILRRCSESLATGKNLLIFPEGSRTVPGATLRFRRGFANVAMAANASIQFVVIFCNTEFLIKGVPWYRMPDRVPRFRIVVGECRDVKKFLRNGNRGSNARKMVREIEEYYRGAMSDGNARK